ncbi:MAG: dihydroneopterin aldolase [Flavobacteriales bacterium]|nr:dihydroneopterin aldolase [Flavobacteriales bacterium]
MGQIALEGMRFYSHQGFYEEERAIGGKYVVDIFFDVDFNEASDTDELSGTINYEEVYELVKEVMLTNAKLIEHLGKKILDQMKRKYPQVTAIELKISKVSPLFSGEVDRVSISMKG